MDTPVRRDEQARDTAAIGNDIQFAIAGEISGDGNIVMLAFPNDMAFPVSFYLSGGERRGKNDQ